MPLREFACISSRQPTRGHPLAASQYQVWLRAQSPGSAHSSESWDRHSVFHSLLFKSSLLPQEENLGGITVNRKKCCSENLVTASNPASSLSFPVLLRITQEHIKCKG